MSYIDYEEKGWPLLLGVVICMSLIFYASVWPYWRNYQEQKVNERIRAAQARGNVITERNGKWVEVPYRDAGIYDPCNAEDMKKFEKEGAGTFWGDDSNCGRKK